MNARLPNFLIVGAAKSGTTSLYHYLKEHPQIFMPDSIKESYFLTGIDFSNINPSGGNYGINFIRTIKEYESLFYNAEGYSAIGEATTGYLYFYKSTIPNIKKYLGNPKILIILRDPVSRAYSNYLHHVRDTYENLSFEDALEIQEEREKENYWWGYQFVKGGQYYLQVKAYMENFNLVKVVLFDDLKKNTSEVVQDIYRFLEVDDNFIPTSISERFNISGSPRFKLFQKFLLRDNFVKKAVRPVIRALVPEADKRKKITARLMNKNLKKEPIPEGTKEYLKDFYRDDILNLSELINRDLSHWLE